MTDSAVLAETVMGTVVSIQVVGTSEADRESRMLAARRAMEWFHQVEAGMTRFDPQSELRALCSRPGVPVKVSPMLFAALRFAVALGEETGGAFDVTVGGTMERAGFDRHHRTGASAGSPDLPDEGSSWADIVLDAAGHTVTPARPLILDLGALAKGLAIDLAARELGVFTDFAIDAGGDLFFAGHNPDGVPWRAGIRHPRLGSATQPEFVETVSVTSGALCTSGDYESDARRSDGATGSSLRHHIVDPRTGRSAEGVASASVLAPSAMVADALATAAFVLGPDEGLQLLARHGVEGMILTSDLVRWTTDGWPGTAVSGERLEDAADAR